MSQVWEVDLRPNLQHTIVANDCSPWRMLLTLKNTIPPYYTLANVAKPRKASGDWIIYIRTRNQMR